MIVLKKLSEQAIMETAHHVDARNLYNTAQAVVSVITLKPGQALKKHITPVDVAFFVLEGTGIVQIGDEKAEVGPRTLVESPKDILHCWYNEARTDLVFMIIKAPRPDKKTIILA